MILSTKYIVLFAGIRATKEEERSGFSKTLIDFSIFSSLIVALYFSYNIKDIFNKDIKIG